jgi:hypothetical protein
MEDTKVGTDAMGAPLAPNPAKSQSPVDQARNTVKKILGMITGRAKS